jgi:hypothetical protein
MITGLLIVHLSSSPPFSNIITRIHSIITLVSFIDSRPVKFLLFGTIGDLCVVSINGDLGLEMAVQSKKATVYRFRSS